MGLQKYQNQNRIIRTENQEIIKTSEEYFCLKTFSGLPLEVQKKIIGFSKIDPFDKTIPDSKEEADYRIQLRIQGRIELNAIIITDN